MALGEPGAVPPLSPMSMSVGDSSMPARLFSHEVGIIFIAGGNVLQTPQLAEMGIDEETLLPLSIANMGALTGSLNMVRGTGTVMVTGLGGLEACMALVPQVWDEMLATDFPNGPVMSMPAKDVLVACDRLDVAAIATLRQSRDALLAQNPGALLANELYERGADGTWVLFDEAATPGIESPSPIQDSTAPATAPQHDPTMTIQEAGMEGIVISDSDRDLGPGPRNEQQIQLLFRSGFRFNPEDQTWQKLFVGEQGAPFMPWETPEWAAGAPKKRGFFGRRK